MDRSLQPGELFLLPSDPFFSLVVSFIVYPANKKKALLLPQAYLSIQNPLNEPSTCPDQQMALPSGGHISTYWTLWLNVFLIPVLMRDSDA